MLNNLKLFLKAIFNQEKEMRISQVGIDLIKEFEGLKLETYVCSGGKNTIGYGTTKINGVNVKKGMTISVEQAEEFLKKDLEVFENAVKSAVKLPINQNQFDALVSFTYNLGGGNLNRSTLLRKLNAGDIQGAADEFLKWNKAGGKVLKGLERRRRAERKLFLS